MFIAGSKVLQRPHRGRSTRICGGRDVSLCRLEHIFPADRARSSTEKTVKALWRVQNSQIFFTVLRYAIRTIQQNRAAGAARRCYLLSYIPPPLPVMGGSPRSPVIKSALSTYLCARGRRSPRRPEKELPPRSPPRSPIRERRLQTRPCGRSGSAQPLRLRTTVYKRAAYLQMNGA